MLKGENESGIKGEAQRSDGNRKRGKSREGAKKTGKEEKNGE